MALTDDFHIIITTDLPYFITNDFHNIITTKILESRINPRKGLPLNLRGIKKEKEEEKRKQAGAELCQALIKLWLAKLR